MEALTRILKELKPDDDSILNQLKGSGTLLFYKLITDQEDNALYKTRYSDEDNFIIIDEEFKPDSIMKHTRKLVDSFLQNPNYFIEWSVKYHDPLARRNFYLPIWTSDQGSKPPTISGRLCLANHVGDLQSVSVKINVIYRESSVSSSGGSSGCCSGGSSGGPLKSSQKQDILADEVTAQKGAQTGAPNARVAKIDDVKIWAYEDDHLRDIRTLLITLHKVSSDERWAALTLKDVTEPSAVKKLYRNAILAFHPDKNEENAAKSEIFHCLHRSYLSYSQTGK